MGARGDAQARGVEQLLWIDGADHFFRPAPHIGKGDERERTLQVLATWLRERF